MTGLDRDEAMQALEAAYGGITEMLDELSEAEYLLPTLCAGWTIQDVLYHLLGDARRALVAFATPAGRDPDVDFVSNWEEWPPPAPACLSLVRRTLDGLLGVSPPVDWDDATYALKGTGRRPLSAADRARLGDLAGRFPLFG